MPRSQSPVVLPGDPTSAMHAATKQYVDNNAVPPARQVISSTGLTGGGALSGDVTLSVVFGSTAGTAAQGNDSRITGAEQSANKAAASGYASLDGTTKVPVAQLPTGGANGILQLDGSGNVPTAIQYGASTSSYGILLLAGDLTGTAAVPKLVGNAYRAVTGNTATVTAADGVLVVTPSSATSVVTVPTPVGNAGKRYIIKKASGATGFAVQIVPAAGLIDGQSSETIMVAGGYREIISDGTNYQIIGGTVIPVITSPTAPTNGATVTPDSTLASVFRYTPAVAGWILGNPTNGVDGDQINIEITPSTTFSLTITGPALTTGITSPVAVASGKKCFVGLRYSGSTWYVIALAVQT